MMIKPSQRTRIVVLLLTCLLLSGNVSVATKNVSDFQESDAVKAVLLYKFISFTKWPEDIDRDKLKIGVLADEVMFKKVWDLNRSLATKNNFSVYEIKNINDYRNVDVLWVGKNDLMNIHSHIKDKPIMVVGEGLSCWHQNLHICLTHQNDAFRFKLDLFSFQQSKLKISSQVIRLAREVRR